MRGFPAKGSRFFWVWICNANSAAQIGAVFSASWQWWGDLISQRWVLMFLLVGFIFLSGKLLMISRAGKPLSLRDNLLFLFFWPGMNVAEFRRAPTVKLRLVPKGIGNLVIGGFLTWVVAREISDPFLATWVAMIGFVWALHGGCFTLLAAFWRFHGRDVMPLMHAPLLARSLADFWGRRWNRAFRDAAHQLVFRRFAPRFGSKSAMLAVFLISGILHDVIVTIPARGGYGGPTLYFLLQGCGMMLETRIPERNRLARRAFAFVFLVGFLAVGYPPEFVENVAEPFFRMLRAIP